jgi:flagellar biosynthesis component FlhA
VSLATVGAVPGLFVFLFVVFAIAAVVSTLVNVGRAQNLADRTGQPRGRATRRVLGSQNPAAELRQMEDEASLRAELAQQRDLLEQVAQGHGAGAVADGRTSEQRLQEVQRLYEQGLINEDEASTKRREILDEL